MADPWMFGDRGDDEGEPDGGSEGSADPWLRESGTRLGQQLTVLWRGMRPLMNSLMTWSRC